MYPDPKVYYDAVRKTATFAENEGYNYTIEDLSFIWFDPKTEVFSILFKGNDPWNIDLEEVLTEKEMKEFKRS